MLNNLFLFLSGIGVFLFGLTLLSKSIMDLGENSFNRTLYKVLKKPLYATLLGAITTGIIQSSTATNSVVVALNDKEAIDKKSSFYLIIGSNIGTTSTAYLALIAKLNFSYILASLIFFPFLCI